MYHTFVMELKTIMNLACVKFHDKYETYTSSPFTLKGFTRLRRITVFV
jgi:hypothetical protein